MTTDTGGREAAWREGDRIRQADGSGFADFVPDEQVRQYMERDIVEGKPNEAAFCAAVLALRQRERSRV